jgi:leader peptidase (prepilin peptidase) / N-methyltransferase
MSSDLGDFAAAFPWFFPVIVFLLGAIVGSFLNVVICRVPAGLSIVRPGSRCACGTPVAWFDNIPILSWLILRGRARCCGRRYGVRYPWVELLTAGLFLACWLLFPPGKAVVGMVFLGVLVCATFIDLDHFIIPDVFTIGAGVLGVLLALLVPALHGYPPGEDFWIVAGVRSLVSALQGLLIGSGLVLWIALLAEALLRKEAMGFGDVKFVGMIGAFCGWQGAVFSVFGGAVVGTVWVLLAWLVGKVLGRPGLLAPKAETPEGEPTEIRLGAQIPFGPMLAIAAAIYFLGAHRWFDAYLAGFASLF